jgi:hypothetical protein
VAATSQVISIDLDSTEASEIDAVVANEQPSGVKASVLICAKVVEAHK